MISVVCVKSVVLACLDNIEVIDRLGGKQSGSLLVKRNLMLEKVSSVSVGIAPTETRLLARFGTSKTIAKIVPLI